MWNFCIMWFELYTSLSPPLLNASFLVPEILSLVSDVPSQKLFSNMNMNIYICRTYAYDELVHHLFNYVTNVEMLNTVELWILRIKQNGPCLNKSQSNHTLASRPQERAHWLCGWDRVEEGNWRQILSILQFASDLLQIQLLSGKARLVIK